MKTLDVQKIINFYQGFYSSDEPQINSLSLNNLGYIKWSAPCHDYPCLFDTYYLYPPFRFDPNTQFLKAANEQGERDEILWTVKFRLGQIAKELFF